MEWLETARRQSGAITRTQLAHAGLTSRQIERLIGSSIEPVHRAVYVHRSAPRSRDQLLWVAALASAGVVSHRSAAEHWGIEHPRLGPGQVSVIVPDRQHRRAAPGVRVYRLPLDRTEVAHPGGLPVTRRDRTIVDLLRAEPAGVAMELLDQALRRRWLDAATLERSIAGGPGRAGNIQLKALLAKTEPGAHAESERLLHRLLRDACIGGWTAQCRVVLPRRVVLLDVGFYERKIGIEVDGRKYHDRYAERFEDDRSRQNQLVTAGWVILRFTWRRLNDDPAGVIEEILMAIEGR